MNQNRCNRYSVPFCKQLRCGIHISGRLLESSYVAIRSIVNERQPAEEDE